MLEGTFFKQTHISSHQRAEIPRFKGEALWVTWMFWMGFCFGSSLVAQMVKCLPAMQKTWVRSLGQEDPLEKEMATHSSTLAWKIPWMEEPDRLQSMELQRVGHDWLTKHFHFFFHILGKMFSTLQAHVTYFKSHKTSMKKVWLSWSDLFKLCHYWIKLEYQTSDSYL